MKNLKNLGSVLNKAEQKEVFGGFGPSRGRCQSASDCCNFQHNQSFGYVCSGGSCVPGIFTYPHPCGL